MYLNKIRRFIEELDHKRGLSSQESIEMKKSLQEIEMLSQESAPKLKNIYEQMNNRIKESCFVFGKSNPHD